MLTFGQGLAAMKGPSCRKRTVQGIWQDDVSESGVVSMKQCDCDERIGIEINSFELYEELRKFFEYQVQEGVFCDIPVESPYFCGYGLKPEEVKDELLNTHLSSDSYSIGTECYDKVSLIETGDTADVKYHSEYLAKGAGLSRAYAVLYNYCKKKSFIEAWCIENAALVEGPVDVNELVELYMLGYIKQKR